MSTENEVLWDNFTSCDIYEGACAGGCTSQTGKIMHDLYTWYILTISACLVSMGADTAKVYLSETRLVLDWLYKLACSSEDHAFKTKVRELEEGLGGIQLILRNL